MDEHVLQNDCDLHLSSSTTLEGNYNYAPHLSEHTLYQNITKPQDHNSCSVPQWIEYQQMAPYYLQYLVGNGISDIQQEIPYNNSGIGCSFTSDDSSLNMDPHHVRHSRHQHEEIPNTQHQIYYQNQVPEELLHNAAQYQSKKSTSTSRVTKQRTYLRQKATDTDRRRRTRIATALDALEDLLPQSKEGNKTNIVDDCIDYIKYLQVQMKELSQNRSVSEPTSNHLLFLEGYGHYIVDEHMVSGPLEDMMGKLLETNSTEAIKLLESRGLYLMPNTPN